MATHGFYYIATGLRKFTFEAIRSARTLRKYWPDVSITLCTDNWHIEATNGYKLFNNVIVTNPSTSNLSWSHHLSKKVEGILNSPYDITAFIDTDTLIKSDKIKNTFDMLGDADIALRIASLETSRCAQLSNASMYYTGFIIYNKTSNNMKNLLENWTQEQVKNIEKLDNNNLNDMACNANCSNDDRRFLLGTDQYSLAKFLRPDLNPDKLNIVSLGSEWNHHAVYDDENIIIDTKPYQKLPSFIENAFGHFRPFNTIISGTFVGITKKNRECISNYILKEGNSSSNKKNIFDYPDPAIKELYKELLQHTRVLTNTMYPNQSQQTNQNINTLKGTVIYLKKGQKVVLPKKQNSLFTGIYWLSISESNSLEGTGGSVKLLDPLARNKEYKTNQTTTQGEFSFPSWNDELILFPSYLSYSIAPIQSEDNCACIVINVG